MPRKFEYRTEFLWPFLPACFEGDTDDEPTDFDHMLATLGAEGWELVNVVKINRNVTAIFKRELEN